MIPFKLNCHVSLTGTCFTTPCSGSCSVQTWLLQCFLGRSPSQFHQTSTINPERSSKIHLTEPKRTRHTSVHLFALVTNSCSHKIQGINVSLQNHHWLCTQFITSDYVPSRSLHSASERRFIVPSQTGTKALSLTFKWKVLSWWNDLPNSTRAAESLPIFKKWLKAHLFHLYLTLHLENSLF